MKRTVLLVLIGWATQGLTVAQNAPLPTIGQIIKTDPRFDKLIPAEAKIEVLASGFVWTEGPIWVKNEAFLLFSDVPQNTIYKWTDKEGVTPFMKPSGYTGVGPYGDEPGSNGLTIDKQGRLIACEHGDRRVTAMPINSPGGNARWRITTTANGSTAPTMWWLTPMGAIISRIHPMECLKKRKTPRGKRMGLGCIE